MNFVDLNRMGKKAVSVKYELQKLASLKKRQVLEAVAEGLIADAETILKENAKDI